jgi:hypothetical protein
MAEHDAKKKQSPSSPWMISPGPALSPKVVALEMMFLALSHLISFLNSVGEMELGSGGKSKSV